MNGVERSEADDLVRALARAVPPFDGDAAVSALARRPWASITFTGARHRLRVELVGAGAVGAAADMLAALPELELDVRGHLVADIALISQARCESGGYVCLELEALTLEDR